MAFGKARAAKFLHSTAVWQLNCNLPNGWEVHFSRTGLAKRRPSVYSALPRRAKPITFVWHPNLHVTGAMVKIQRKLCDFRRKEPEQPAFIQEVLDLNKHKTHPSSWPHINIPVESRWTRGIEYENFRKIRALCVVNTSSVQTHRPHYTHIHKTHSDTDKESDHMIGEHGGKFYKFPGQHCDRLWNPRSLQYNKRVYRELFFRITNYHSQFSLQNLQQRFGAHGAIPPLTHTSLIFHRFLSHMPHTDSRGALSAILYQIRWVLGSLPPPYSTFFRFFFSVSPNYVDMTLNEAMISATYWHHLECFFSLF